MEFDDFTKNIKSFFKRLPLNSVTLIEDVLGICHLVFVVPDTLSCIMIGPFRTEELNQSIVDKLHLDADKIAGLRKTLITFPIISDTLMNLNLIPVISTAFDKEKFELHHYTEEVPKIFLPDSELFYGKQSSEEERMQMLGGFSILRLSSMVGMAGITITKEQLLDINAKLNKVKKK